MTGAIEGLERLAKSVGTGEIVASVTVDQPYAQRQHEELEWAHPRGGRAKYLESPLLENAAHLVQTAADHLLTDLDIGMAEVAEKMVGFVEDNAPRLDHLLRYSGQPEVMDHSVVKYTRPPKVARIKK